MSPGVTQLTDADMLAGAKQINEGVTRLGTLFQQIAAQAEELKTIGMKGAAGNAMHAKVVETQAKVNNVNQLATDKANAIVKYVHHNQQGQAESAGFFQNA